MLEESMMKWRVRRENRCSSTDQEDIRRSLEILDNVLAEFDDGDYFFGEPSPDEVILRRRRSPEVSDFGSSEKSSLDSFQTCSTDGSTSQSLGSSCQSRRYSPPPVPKRSPGTRLSAVGSPADDKASNDNDPGLSEPCDCPSRMEDARLLRSPSVAVRRKLFEKSPPLSGTGPRKFLDSGSPLLKKSGSDARFPTRDYPTTGRRLTNSASDSKLNEVGRHTEPVRAKEPAVCKCLAAKEARVEPGVLSDRTNVDESLEERLRRLNQKFARVRRLLREKKIQALTQKPPDFVPPPPPKPPRKPQPNNSRTKTEDACLEPSDSLEGKAQLSNGHRVDPLAHPIEDLPKLLPTDALQYGLSYTLEDDLSPGVKEILTSTPKPDKIQLSTFSQSVSSLGYGSSQSEQDLNLSFENSDKVPVVTLKSQTLPIGIRMVPPLARVEDLVLDNSDLQRNFDPFRPEDHFRSSSAPPSKQPPKPKAAFSRKDKRTATRNEDGISVKSNSSSEDRRSPLDGSTNSSSKESRWKEAAAAAPEGKRKSVWKSILRRK